MASPESVRIGSLCSGYGGLDLAALAVFGGAVAWHAETDPDAAAVLEHRFPGVPNLGDITAADWSAVPPVDVLTAGYPCQPESLAGQRKGAADERWIWPHVASAVRVLRPRIVLLENVAGHTSLGFGSVLGDLARLGFDAEWLVCKASDLGAAHQRARLFVLAWPANAEGDGRGQGPVPADPPAAAGQPGHPARAAAADPEGQRHRNHRTPGEPRLPAPALGSRLHPAADPDRDTVRQQPVAEPRGELSPVAGHARPGAAAHPPGLGEREPSDPHHPEPALRTARPVARRRGLLPTPRATDGAKGGPNQRGSGGDLALPAAVQPAAWGRYANAIARHEHLTGRPVPEPTEPGPNAPRLAPRFTEWLMCLPDGWVTAVPGVPRSAQLRILGNGVIPPQAEAALRTLIQRSG